ncbi:WD40 repeat domain-containing protein [Roseiconus nitratireducens]|nr:c-type cytochrome domain-containing protein [Roseiconus nitratireducens]
MVLLHGILDSADARADLPLKVAELERTDPVDFGSEILPILKRNCVACHHKGEAEGGLMLESITTLKDGGDSGQAVVAGDAASSLLMSRVTGEEEPLMPPEDNSVGASALTPEELGLLRLWIQQGASGSDAAAESIQWQPVPESVRPTYAIDFSPAGDLVAFTRGNRVILMDLETQAEEARLVDASLNVGPVADVDLVQSVAFSPDSRQIATGGFRSVRLWERTRVADDDANPLQGRTARRVAFNASRDRVAIVNAIGDLEIWNLSENQPQVTIRSLGEPLAGLAWVETAPRLIAGTTGGTIAVYDATTGATISINDLALSIDQVAVGRDGAHVAVSDQQGSVRLMKVNQAATESDAGLEVVHDSLGQVNDAAAIAVLSSPKAAVVIASESGGMKIIDAENNQIIRTIDVPAPVGTITVFDNESKMILGGSDGIARVCDIASGNIVQTCQGTRGEQLAIDRTEHDVARQKTIVAALNARTGELDGLLKKEEEALAAVVKKRDELAKTHADKESKLVDAVKAVQQAKSNSEKAGKQAADAAQAIVSTKASMQMATAKVNSLSAVVPNLEQNVRAAEAKLAALPAASEAGEPDQGSMPDSKGPSDVGDEDAAEPSKPADSTPADSKSADSNADSGSASGDEPTEKDKPKNEEPNDQDPSPRQAAEKELEQSAAALAKAKSDLQSAQASVKDLQSKIEALTQTEAAAKAAKDAAEKELKTANEAVSKAEAEKAKSEQELKNQQRAVDAATKARDRAAAVIPEHQSRLQAATRRQTRLEQQLAGQQQRLVGPAKSVIDCSVRPDGQRFATLHRDGTSTIYRLSDGRPVDHLESAATAQVSLVAPSLTPQVVLLPERLIRLSDATIQCQETRFRWELRRQIGAVTDPQVIVDRVTAIDFSPDGLTVAVGSGEPSRSGTVKVFSTQTGEMLRDFGELHSDSVLGLAFSPDGHTLASAAADKTLRLTDVATGELIRTLEGHTHHVLAVAWQNDGRTLASAGADQSVRVWDSGTGETLRTIGGFPQELTGIEFVDSGSQFVAACGSGQIRLADGSNGKTIRNFDAAGDFLFSVAISPDGQRLVAGGQSGVVRLWNLSDGKKIAEWE